MRNKIILIFERSRTGEVYDLEVPLHITANELLYGLNQGLHLGLNLEDSTQCYLCTENPIALLKGNTELADFNLHDGTRICFNK